MDKQKMASFIFQAPRFIYGVLITNYELVTTNCFDLDLPMAMALQDKARPHFYEADADGRGCLSHKSFII
ncbi:MAG: hypothetical protein IGS23_01725 [Rivularia sp. T60_A2020_040]|nr:hypothetical protein [Rivularia sp. T60_A2020_040]